MDRSHRHRIVVCAREREKSSRTVIRASRKARPPPPKCVRIILAHTYWTCSSYTLFVELLLSCCSSSIHSARQRYLKSLARHRSLQRRAPCACILTSCNTASFPLNNTPFNRCDSCKPLLLLQRPHPITSGSATHTPLACASCWGQPTTGAETHLHPSSCVHGWRRRRQRDNLKTQNYNQYRSRYLAAHRPVWPLLLAFLTPQIASQRR